MPEGRLADDSSTVSQRSEIAAEFEFEIPNLKAGMHGLETCQQGVLVEGGQLAEER
jgi:hypothetical protein